MTPWTPKSATRHTGKARTPKSRRQWSHVANSALKRGLGEGAAIREANSVVARSEGGSRMARRKRHGGKKRSHKSRK